MDPIADFPPRELEPVQKLIEAAGRGVSQTIGRLSEQPHRFGSPKAIYLADALKLLNRSWLLVRAVYAPDEIPTISGTAPGEPL